MPASTILNFAPFARARDHAISMARDRIAKLHPEAKAGALRYIDNALELWKFEQADADGMVPLEPISVGLLGMQYPSDLGISLAGLTKGERPRVSVMKIRPEQCAGPFVHCASDLWVKLWSEQYPGITEFDKLWPLDVVMAILVERDGSTMPVESLASAVHYVWITAWTTLQVYQDAIREVGPEVNAARSRRTKQLADLLVARTVTASRKKERAKKLASDARQMAVDMFVSDISLSNDGVVSRLLEYKDFQHLSRRGLSDRIKGAQREAKTRLSRRPPM